MSRLQSILLATDFSYASQAAAQAVISLARTFSSRVTIFHALEQTWPVSSQTYQDLLMKHLQEKKVDVADLVVGWGPPAETILRKAQEVQSDLLVIGAGRQTRPEQFSVGPIATTVIEQAPQAVLAVRPGEPELKFRKILCPVDQSGPAGHGLRNAIQLARGFGCELVVLTVVPEVNWLVASAETGHFTDAQAEYHSHWHQEFNRFVDGIPAPGVTITRQSRSGVAHEQIALAAKENQADLIVVGATGRTGLVRALLGSTTRRLLDHLPCSLLVVKEAELVEDTLDGDLRLMKALLAEGQSLLASGAYENAMAKFRQVLSHNPFHIEATEGLAQCYESLNRKEEADHYRRRAAKLR